MAEILALASGVTSVAQVAGQIGASALRLKTLWSEVKDVPDSINSLILQLELLGPVLSEMENQFSRVQAIMQTDRLAKLSLEHSRQALQNLEAVVQDLHQQISSKRSLKRTVVKVKVTLKRDTIRTYQERLQNALQLLSLSQQTHMIALSKVQTSLIVSEIRDCRDAERKVNHNSGNSNTSTRDRLVSSAYQNPTADTSETHFDVKILPWKNSDLFWRFSFQIAEISVSPDETNKVYQARLQLPSWLLPKAWELQIRKAYSGWKIFLKPWTVRAYDSKVFNYALQGEMEDLLRALKSNEASLYDRNPRGWTLLHYAASKGQLEIFQKLLKLGLSVQETDVSGITPLYHLCRSDDHLGNALDIYRYLSSQDALDEVVQDVFLATYRKSRQSSLYRFIWNNSELLDFVIAQFHPTFYQQPVSDCFSSIDWIYVDPQVLLKVLTRHNTVSPASLLRQMRENVESSLHELARLYFEKCLDSIDCRGILRRDHEFSRWRELVRWMFVKIAFEDLCRVGHEPWEHVTPLFAGLLNCDPGLSGDLSEHRYVQRRLLVAIKAWLEDLTRAGVDLNSYGAQEWRQYQIDEWLQTWRWPNLADGHHESVSAGEGPLLVSVTHDPQPENWAFKWDVVVEVFAGDYWGTIEDPAVSAPRMPGIWIED